jgi:hypothetical protein
MTTMRMEATRIVGTNIVIVLRTNIVSTIMAHTTIAIMATASSGRTSCRRSTAQPTPPT